MLPRCGSLEPQIKFGHEEFIDRELQVEKMM